MRCLQNERGAFTGQNVITEELFFAKTAIFKGFTLWTEDKPLILGQI